ncbi:MAG: hypothetical protein U0176_11695 [Bacteroidia bacterium]
MSAPKKDQLLQRRPASPSVAPTANNASGPVKAAPAFALSAEPMQRKPIADSSTNYRFDTGRITAEDLSDPKILNKLDGMTKEQLESYLQQVTDPEVVRHIEGLVAQKTKAPDPEPERQPEPPAAAAVFDPRLRVQRSERAMYDQLKTYMTGLTARVEKQLGNLPADDAHLGNNAYMQEALEILRRAEADIIAENIIVRFDKSLVNTPVMAAYDFDRDTMRLRPITGPGDLGPLVANLIHEYTHKDQDAAMEALLLGGGAPLEHMQSDEIEHETQARRTGVYMASALRSMGEMKGQDNMEMFGDESFETQFEDERVAEQAVISSEAALKGPKAGRKKAAKDLKRAKKDKKDASKLIHDKIERGYAGQIDRNTPSVSYLATLGADNHITLHLGGQSIDLGEVPAGIRISDALTSFVEDKIADDPNKMGIFDKGKKKGMFKVATIIVAYQGRKLGEFAIPQ